MKKTRYSVLRVVIFYQRPSIANLYGRANMNEGVEVVIKENLGRKCAV